MLRFRDRNTVLENGYYQSKITKALLIKKKKN